jgi:dUTP pyrophosphatase
MRHFYIVKDEFRKYLNKDIKLPTRATQNSAGYDFYSPDNFIINSKAFAIIATDIKVNMCGDEFLQIVPRSSIGIKKNLMLKNTIGIIDSDYFENEENDGNILIALYNYGNEKVEIKEGERIAQGIFCKYGVTIDDKPLTILRKGGIGSSN